jgi:hypothetical protein
MNQEGKQTSAYYKDAIQKLRQYLAVETDEENCEEAAAKIREYRFKIIDNAFDDILQRTKKLTTLMHDLKAIIENASNTSPVSGAIAGLNSIVTEISKILTR